jgi:hypothetical protein
VIVAARQQTGFLRIFLCGICPTHLSDDEIQFRSLPCVTACANLHGMRNRGRNNEREMRSIVRRGRKNK